MIEFCFPEQVQRTNSRKRIFASKRFSVIVKINNVGFPEARFYESDGMPVGPGVLFTSGNESHDVLMQHITLEMGNSSRL